MPLSDESEWRLVPCRMPCTNCDGHGFYTGWPHTTCPNCGGSGSVVDADAEPVLKRVAGGGSES